MSLLTVHSELPFNAISVAQRVARELNRIGITAYSNQQGTLVPRKEGEGAIVLLDRMRRPHNLIIKTSASRSFSFNQTEIKTSDWVLLVSQKHGCTLFSGDSPFIQEQVEDAKELHLKARELAKKHPRGCLAYRYSYTGLFDIAHQYDRFVDTFVGQANLVVPF